MADGQSTTMIRCPQCSEPVTVPVRLAYQRGANPTMAFDLSPVQDHMDTHVATYSTELPHAAG